MCDGFCEGLTLGGLEGELEGAMVGLCEGEGLGGWVCPVGAADGEEEGIREGAALGGSVGEVEGALLGNRVIPEKRVELAHTPEHPHDESTKVMPQLLSLSNK